MRGGNGTRDTEEGFLAYRNSDGTIGTVNLPTTNQFRRITFNTKELLPDGAILLAVFHSHPTTRSSLPSFGDGMDSATAKTLSVPVFVMHRNGLSSVSPDGTIEKEIREGTDWMKGCENGEKNNEN
jgi:hypothetical protein